ncbi:MAG: 50S ribosomal protein L11 [Candidatus Thermoplasmatota archaeon]|jgi:large subunit ribosomal protein L11|nr:50S ribosomal protein L11 [Candidatus Thermoplasmatota archaeon]MCL5680456.1 50S ribosomal protein L11 [Candidatus Thermoplasmatota archaeon]
MPQEVSVMVEGGKATAGPPLGPALGPLGINLGLVLKEINDKTKAFSGMQVPVKVSVDPETKKFNVTVGMPPVSALLKKELGVETATGAVRTKVSGNLELDQIKKIAETKIVNMNAASIQTAVLEVLGTCVSMGVTVNKKDPKEIQKLIKDGSLKL